jgi:hypothetical protein
MEPISQIPGMNGMATSLHDPIGTFIQIISKPGINQLTIPPAMLLNYCIIYPGSCSGIIGNQINKPKPQNSSIIINNKAYENK